MKKILIAGADGQLGQALIDSVPDGMQAIAANRQIIDITNQAAVNDWVGANQPNAIINAAAYTAVDKAETDSAMAKAVNTDGPLHLATAASNAGIPLVQVSTDFVFNGKAGPYKTDDKTDPLSVYGETKRDGEVAALGVSGAKVSVVRTAWVYNAGGGNFVSTMLRLMKEKDSIGVVADQIGSPTYVPGLASACWAMLDKELTGVFHWTDAGVASWYDFAVAIQEEALALGLLEKSIPVAPLTTADFPTPATRPSNSVLDKSESWKALGVTAPHWRTNLRVALTHLRQLG